MRDILVEIQATLKGIHHEVANLSQLIRLNRIERRPDGTDTEQLQKERDAARNTAAETTKKLYAWYHRCDELEAEVKALSAVTAELETIKAEKNQWYLLSRILELRLEEPTEEAFQKALLELESDWIDAKNDSRVWDAAVEEYQHKMWDGTLARFKHDLR